MNLLYVGVSELWGKFKSYNLDFNNVISFLVEEDGDKYKYLLKLYLIATLENYKHIDFLKSDVIFDDILDEDVSMEIINKNSEKKFWEFINNYLDEDDNIIKMKRRNWIFKYLSSWEMKKIILEGGFPDDLDSYNTFQIKKLTNKIGTEKNFIMKILYRKQLLKEKKEHNERIKEIKDSFEDAFGGYMTCEQFSVLCQKFQSMHKEDPNYDFLDSIHVFLEKSYFVDSLKFDLIYNYKMICFLFSQDFTRECGLDELIFRIRNNMKELSPLVDMINMNFNRGCFGAINDGSYDVEYRSAPICQSGDFWERIASPGDIPKKMDELFTKYEEIKKLQNDESYVLECYKLSQDFLQIHPYENGNGRTSKYLFYSLLLKRNILPFTITDSYNLTPCYEKTKSSSESIINYAYGRNEIIYNRFCGRKK